MSKHINRFLCKAFWLNSPKFNKLQRSEQEVSLGLLALAFLVSLIHSVELDVAGLFTFTAGLAAFLFIMVTILMFIFIYDNLRRGKKETTTSP